MVTSTYKQPQSAPVATAGKRTAKKMNNPDWTPMDGVGISTPGGTKTSGIKIRGTGAAERGVMARGPMA
jgi:hypothetical protein